MRIVEILIPKSIKYKDLSAEKIRQIDFLQRRIDGYVDKILDPNTTNAGKEFLKSKLRDDYYDLKGLLPHIHKIAENQPLQYEVYDRKTGEKVPGRGPYNSKEMARRAVDKLDNAYGAYRYGWRPIKTINELFQAGKDWKQLFSGSEEYAANFTVGKYSYLFRAFHEINEPGTWAVEFLLEKSTTNTSYGIANTGNASEVFSTVVDIMRNFLRKYDSSIKTLTFSANEPSRKKLYYAMIKRLLPTWSVKQSGYYDIYVTKPESALSEAVNKVPITNKDFDALKLIFEKPVPAAVAHIYISEFIDDDEFSDQLKYLEDADPGRDVRPLIVEWIDRVMPDQMYRFRGIPKSDREGLMSPIHGYDTYSHRGQSMETSGNAYGRR